MLQARRAALRLAERPLVCQRRGYADPPYSPDPTTSDRKMDVQEPPPVCSYTMWCWVYDQC